jgi:hypothetical protein
MMVPIAPRNFDSLQLRRLFGAVEGGLRQQPEAAAFSDDQPGNPAMQIPTLANRSISRHLRP